jgi:hypothetical protein
MEKIKELLNRYLEIYSEANYPPYTAEDFEEMTTEERNFLSRASGAARRSLCEDILNEIKWWEDEQNNKDTIQSGTHGE